MKLHIGASETRVVSHSGDEPGDTIVLPIGYAAQALSLRHEPSTPLELENAIAVVEDAVMPLARNLPRQSELVGTGSAIQAIAQAAGKSGNGEARMTLDEVEHLFQQLVAISEGRPAASGGVPSNRTFTATLLILREFMHHLGFEEIRVEAFKPPQPPSPPGPAQ